MSGWITGVKPTSSHARAQIAAQLPRRVPVRQPVTRCRAAGYASTAPPPVLREGAGEFWHPQFDSAKSGAEDSLGGVSFRRDKPGHPLFCGFQGEPNLRAVIRCCCRSTEVSTAVCAGGRTRLTLVLLPIHEPC